MANRRPVVISTQGFPQELGGTADSLYVGALLLETGGIINVGGSKINGVAFPTSGTDAANKNYVDSLVNGLSWLEPVKVLAMVSDADQGGSPPVAPVTGTSYVINNWGGGMYTNGHIAERGSASWYVLGPSAIANGTRVVMASTGISGSFTATATNCIAVYNGATWDYTAPTDGDAVLVVDGEYNENQAFVYDNTEGVDAWIQFGGYANIVAGDGLNKTGNEIYALSGNGIGVSATAIYAVGNLGISVTSAGINVKPTNGLAVSAGGVYVDGNLGISVTAAGVNVKPTSGIGVSAGGVYARTGNGITIVGGDLVVTAGNGIGVDATGVYAVGTNGIGVSAGGIHALLGRGLELSGTSIIADGNLGISVTTEGINAKVGYGLALTTSGIVVTAGNGIGVDATGVYAVGTNGIGVSAGGIHVTYGRGLTLSGTNLIADGSTGILVTADGIEVVGLPSGFWIGTTTATTNATYVTADNLNTLTDGSDASALHYHSSSYSLLTAGEALAKGDAVYISSNGKVSKASYDVVAEAQVIGIVSTTYAADDLVRIYSSGVVQGAISGATANNTVYLSVSTQGYRYTAPTASGSRVILLGYAVNATDIAVKLTDYGQKL